MIPTGIWTQSSESCVCCSNHNLTYFAFIQRISKYCFLRNLFLLAKSSLFNFYVSTVGPRKFEHGYFELKTISFGFCLQSVTIDFDELPLFRTICRFLWGFENAGFICICLCSTPCFFLGISPSSQQPLHRVGVWWLKHAYWILWNGTGKSNHSI